MANPRSPAAAEDLARQPRIAGAALTVLFGLPGAIGVGVSLVGLLSAGAWPGALAGLVWSAGLLLAAWAFATWSQAFAVVLERLEGIEARLDAMASGLRAGEDGHGGDPDG